MAKDDNTACLNGRALYRQNSYLHAELQWHSELINAQKLCNRAQDAFKQVIKDQTSEENSKGLALYEQQQQEQEHQKVFKVVTKTFLDETRRIVTEGKEKIIENFAIDTKRGIRSAFWQDILAQLKIAQESEDMPDRLDDILQYLKDISDVFYEKGAASNNYNRLGYIVNQYKAEDLINGTLQGDIEWQHALSHILVESKNRLIDSIVLANYSIGPAKISDSICLCSFDVFDTVQDGLEKICKTMRSTSATPNVTNADLTTMQENTPAVTGVNLGTYVPLLHPNLARINRLASPEDYNISER